MYDDHHDWGDERGGWGRDREMPETPYEFDPPEYTSTAADARRIADLYRPMGTVHVVAPRLPVVQNPPTPEALIAQLRWEVPPDYGRSMATFREAGLTDTAMGWLIAVTQVKHDLPADARWRYFCGCAWRTVRGG